jgi:S-DNA-T family DNA segregation ATPase FtsK/SpoIIIE
MKAGSIQRLFPKVRNSALMVGLQRRRQGHGFVGESAPKVMESVAGSTVAVAALQAGSACTVDSRVLGRNLLPPDNPDKMKPSVDLSKPLRGVAWWLRHVKSTLARYWSYVHPPLTADQLEEKERQEAEKRFVRLMRRECMKYARMISEKWAQLGYRHKSPDGRRVHKVRFDLGAWNENGTLVRLHAVVDPSILPEGVRLADLADEKNANELLATVGHPAVVSLDIDGLIVEIHRAGKEGLPEMIPVVKLWDEMPDNKPLLTFPVGVADNARNVYIDLDDCPHLLVAGGTKQGKSNFINAILCTFIRRLTPAQVQFALFDLKEGLEFNFFVGLPHIIQLLPEKDLVEILDEVQPAMDKLHHIMIERMRKIKGAGFKSFNDYNLHRKGKNKMPALVVVFDEFGTIVLTPGFGWFTQMLTDIANRARAAGIYIVLGTQNPRADVVSTLIKLNFQVRMAFSVDMPASMSILGNRMAVGLACRGRAVCQNFDETFQVQTPRITDDIIKATVYRAITGKDIKVKANATVDVEEMLQFALDRQDGNLQTARLFEVFRHKKLRRQQLINILQEAEEQEFILSGTKYRVLKGTSQKPRRLERID